MASPDLNADGEFLDLTTRGVAARRVLELLEWMDEEESTRALQEAIRLGTIGFGLYLVGSLKKEKKWTKLDPFKEAVEAASSTLRDRFAGGSERLLELPRAERALVFFHAPDLAVLRRRLLKELRTEPGLLPRILEVVFPEVLEVPVTRKNIEGLDARLDFKALAEATAGLKLDSLSKRDRELVKEFRAWVGQRASGTEGSASKN